VENHFTACYGGFGGNLHDGKIVCSAPTHIGPEDPQDNHDYRYLSDFTVTWKATNRLTSITDLSYVDEPVQAEGYGVAQYFTYALTNGLKNPPEVCYDRSLNKPMPLAIGLIAT
jgi:hypothetical protein